MKIRKEYIWRQLDATTEMTVSRQKASNLWKIYIYIKDFWLCNYKMQSILCSTSTLQHNSSPWAERIGYYCTAQFRLPRNKLKVCSNRLDIFLPMSWTFKKFLKKFLFSLYCTQVHLKKQSREMKQTKIS